MTDSPELVNRALERWLQALQGFGAPEPVVAAMTEDAEVLRFGWDEHRGVLGERFQGQDAIAAWCGRSPREVRFALAGSPRAGPDGSWRARYQISIGDFVNHGDWQLQLAPDGRIARLEHQPEDLPVDWRTGIPAGKRLPGMSPTPRELQAAAAAYTAAPQPHQALSRGATDDASGHDHDHGHDHGPALGEE